MKKLLFGLMALLCLTVVSCGKPDYKALAEKAQNNPTTLTQEDYSQMLDYVDNVFSQSPEEQNKTLSDPNDLTMIFWGTCTMATMGGDDMPELDKDNQKRYSELMTKFQKQSADFQDDSEESFEFEMDEDEDY